MPKTTGVGPVPFRTRQRRFDYSVIAVTFQGRAITLP